MGFLNEDYLLETETAKRLYHEIRSLPILDPHSHIDIEEVVHNETYDDIWEVEGATDHYVWELMRKRGVPEKQITGSASNREKWMALAEVFPEFAGNPTYEWIHLDLQRQFGIDELISADTAEEIWETTKVTLSRDEMRPRELLREMSVEVITTTDDPTSSLADHKWVAAELDGIEVRPTWRPDAAVKIGQAGWVDYIDQLGEATDTDVSDLDGFLTALKVSHDHFEAHGCKASDIGVQEIVSKPVSDVRARQIYRAAYTGTHLDPDAIQNFEAYVLERVGELNHETEWVTQLHIGPARDYRQSLYERLGADSGGDISTQNIEIAGNIEYFLNTFDGDLEVVLYTVDPTHFPTIATIARAYPNVSLGAAWWFNDSPFGMEQQLEYIGTVDLLANYAGMVSDSRKLISYGSRFEMFRRSLANTVGQMVERGQLPEHVAVDLVRHVCYDRPKRLWGF